MPAPNSPGHPQQHRNALGETCWINKYSEDAPGHVFFMSSFRYQTPHSLRSDASITELIFVKNDLFEKPLLKTHALAGSAREAGGVLEGPAVLRDCRGAPSSV